MTHPCRAERYVVATDATGVLWKCVKCQRVWTEHWTAA